MSDLEIGDNVEVNFEGKTTINIVTGFKIVNSGFFGFWAKKVMFVKDKRGMTHTIRMWGDDYIVKKIDTKPSQVLADANYF